MANQVFVSPGVYTSEKDLTYITRQVGVTTLGLVGETTQGPAFQPIFVSNYGEFQSFFGGLNNTLVNGPDGNGAPLYELPYIAKSYLSQSNQLFVTRILGLSGYDAGRAWAIVLEANIDPSTAVITQTNTNPIVKYTATTDGTFVKAIINDTNLAANASLVTGNTFFTLATAGSSTSFGTEPVRNDDIYSGVTWNFYTTSAGLTPTVIDNTTTAVTSTVSYSANFITYTATTGSTTLVTPTIADSTLNAYYAANLFTLQNLATASIGSTATISPMYTANGSLYNGISATYKVISTGNIIQLSASTTGTSRTVTSTPFISFTADTNHNLSAVTITESLINTYYNAGKINLSGLSYLSSGSTGTIPTTFTNTGTVYTGASSNYTVTSIGYTPVTIATSTQDGNYYIANEPFITFSATTGGSLLSYSVDSQAAQFDLIRTLVGAKGVGTVGNFSSIEPILTSGIGAGYSNSDIVYTAITGTQYAGAMFGIWVIQTGATTTGFYTGTTRGWVQNYTATGNQQYITGSTSGVTTEYSGTGVNYLTGTTSGVTTNYSGAQATIYVTGSTSGNTQLYTATGYADVDNKVVALIRSRGTVDATTQLHSFQVSGGTYGLQLDPSITAATIDPLGAFSLSGKSTTQGLFNYTVSFDKTQKNFISKVLGRTAQDGKTALYLEEFYENMFNTYNAAGKILGVDFELIDYGRTSFSNYLQPYQSAVTPYVVSELRGNKVLRLFRLITISDGDMANEQIKISIVNVKPDVREFDIHIRSFYDTDAAPVVLETYTRLTMNPASGNYIAKRIGTTDGNYASKSNYILVEMDDASDTSDAFPAGFVGVPERDYTLNSNPLVVAPSILYKQTYSITDNKRKVYLGLSDTVGIDVNLFEYKGLSRTNQDWTGLTHGFHMDINASGVTIDDIKISNGTGGFYSPTFIFDTGDATFTTEAGLVGGPYEKIYARKFTFAPYGGFDGWDIYRTRRSNLDGYQKNGVQGKAGTTVGTFKTITLSNGDIAINSDYYAYLEGIHTFSNPEAVNINVFATPGIDTFDNTELVNSTIEMIETQRADSLYITTTPDTDASGTALLPSDVTDALNGYFDSNYTATYWPWIQILDAENNVYIYVPPTRDVVRNIALTDNIAFPWFAVAGIQRGDVDAIKARVKLTLSDRDTLYENRINPIATFVSDGIKIWGNKTLQVNDTALNRINVRRLLLQARKLISAVAIRLLFEQNDSIVRNQFLSLVNPILDNIRAERGLTDFRVVLSNNPEDIDRNQLTGQIFLKPTRALEFIQVEFVIMNTGASFENI